MMNRAQFLQQCADRAAPWDFAVIGGGATGAAIAMDAAARGYAVALLEQCDFGKGTSSRSTKLVHGGVRYLQQGNISLVMEALKERGLLRQNAPHLVRDLQFIVPSYLWWEAPFYGIGLKTYDLLAGRHGFGPSQWLSREETLERIPTLQPEGLRGGVKYHDGQFDDARLLINLVQTAADHGACALNYARVMGLTKDAGGRITGLVFHDAEAGRDYRLGARCVINATGPFCDAVRRLDEAGAAPLISPSQGVHLVLPREFLPRETALMVPRTRDGRVLFAIPWHGHVVAGTTDTPIPAPSLEPKPFEQEVDFILETAGGYLARRPTRADVLSVFAGIRPLVKAGAGASTAQLSRDHTLQISPAGVVTITGGKWTTCRKMAEDCVDQAVATARLEKKPCVTRELRVHGYHPHPEQLGPLAVYGSDAEALDRLTQEEPALAAPLHEALPITGAQIVWAARREWARTVEDVLARRTRALFLDARAALAMAPAAARLLARELGRDAVWEQQQLDAFARVARHYLANP